jgi:hypothetical protein
MRQLKKERDRVQQQLTGLNAALEAFAGIYRGQNGTKPRRKMSAKGRARIAAAQRARWAKVKVQAKSPKLGERTMSASARRKIAEAQRARWAKFRREKKQRDCRPESAFRSARFFSQGVNAGGGEVQFSGRHFHVGGPVCSLEANGDLVRLASGCLLLASNEAHRPLVL